MHTRLTLLSIGIMCCAGAGAITFDAPVKLALPTSGAHPVLSPDASKMLYTSDDHCGLVMLDLGNMSTTVIDRAMAAGFNPAFSPDSRSIVYRTARLDDGLTVRDVRVYDLDSRASRTKAPYSRAIDQPASLTGATDYAVAAYDNITICRQGHTTDISPLADAHSYLWASLSPDGTKLLFTEPFSGVFVANADGSDPVRIAEKGDFASWVDDNNIIYVLSHDDGYVILDSTLMTVSADGSGTRPLTDTSMKIGEASASKGRVVFSTLTGDIYMMQSH